MLPKARRIDKTTFKTLNGRGMSYHSPLLFLSIYKQSNNQEKPLLSRFAVLCSKKVSLKAVDRNRLRRRVYRTLELLLPQIHDGFFCIISIKKEAKDLDKEDLENHLKDILNKQSLLMS